MEKLDQTLLAKVRRKAKGGSPPMLSLRERIAVNLFWRKGVPIAALMEVFNCSKNTIYSNCLTGNAPSYIAGHRAKETNDLIDAIGEAAAEAQNITPDMIRAVNAANRKLADLAA